MLPSRTQYALMLGHVIKMMYVPAIQHGRDMTGNITLLFKPEIVK